MKTILLYYKYTDVQFPAQQVKQQKELCQNLGLKGRIIIAPEGINGTVAGAPQACHDYIQHMNAHPFFHGIDFKISQCEGEPFPRMRVVEKEEITRMGKNPQEISYRDTGTHLSPQQAHELISNNKNLVILDARNNYEAAIGKFIGAVVPDVETFREFPDYIDKNQDIFKDKEVLMYCTGGIRCERASAYLKSKGVAKQVYQITGGIDRYAQAFPDGYFRGKNYVFDGRIAVPINNDVLGNCKLCDTSADDYYNCIYAACNKQLIICPDCVNKHNATCSKVCKQAILDNPARMRKIPHKTASCLL
ncbi:MAG: rhodanese-related sulfurtransferase [Candidatus Babeliaceae bacterium]|nr:rhodanese-related sulfurtransferase [Candidatus Babeliaceae bacterium]